MCKNFNAASYSRSIKGINIKLGTLAHHDKTQLQDKGHNSESYSFRVMPLFNLILLSRMLSPEHCMIGTPCGALVFSQILSFEFEYFCVIHGSYMISHFLFYFVYFYFIFQCHRLSFLHRFLKFIFTVHRFLYLLVTS